jgi:hypothetical protein
MLLKNLPTFLCICAFFSIAMIIGFVKNPSPPPRLQEQIAASIPSIGRIQVLNGCGADGAADQMTDFLRAKKFDVTNKGNAASWNYPFTLVVSHTKDLTIARQIALALNTDHIVLIRKEDRTCNVTVIIGPDYRERIR